MLLLHKTQSVAELQHSCNPLTVSSLQARFERTEQLMQSLGPRAVLIPSANHPDVMAGQGTVAMEFLEQVAYNVECTQRVLCSVLGVHCGAYSECSMKGTG